MYFRVSDKDSAWDLTQECFLKMLNYAKNPKNKIKNPKALLYKIAKNLLADFFKHQQKHKTEDIENIKHKLKDEVEIEDILEDKNYFNLIIKELNNMPEDHKNLIIFRYIDGLSFSEISKIMQKSQVSLRVQVTRIIKSLRIKLSQSYEK